MVGYHPCGFLGGASIRPELARHTLVNNACHGCGECHDGRPGWFLIQRARMRLFVDVVAPILVLVSCDLAA